MIRQTVGLLQEVDTWLEGSYLYPIHINCLLQRSAKELLEHAGRLGTASSPADIDRTVATLDSLFALADEQINTTDFYLVSGDWLALYSDSSLLRALCDILTAIHKSADRSSDTAIALKRLDMAIIISGAIASTRMDWIQRAIAIAQSVGCPTQTSYSSSLGVAPAHQRPKLGISTDLLYAPAVIPHLPAPPSLASYLAHHLHRPFVLPGYILDPDSACPPWPAVTRWADSDYLLSRVGRGRWVPVEEGAAYDDESWGQRIVPFEDFLERAGFRSRDSHGSSRPMYLAQHSLFRQFPTLERDIVIPDYAWSRPAPSGDCPNYQPPDNKDGLVINVWIGSGSGEIVSPAHTDPYYNCYAQVVGRKRVWLAPPHCSAYMQCHGGESRALSAKYMSNTSRLPLLRSGMDIGQLAKQFPSFMAHVWPHSMEAVLEPGDLLVMPPGWWHAMRGEGNGPGWSVSMWY